MINRMDIIFKLLQSELFQSPLEGREITHEEYEQLMALADEQTVSGLIAASLMRNEFKLGKYDAIDLYTRKETVAESNDLINEQIGGFSGFLTQKGIEFVIVKGQMMAALYPDVHSRMTGDVDLYFPGENFQRVKQFVESKLGKELEKYSDGKHVEFYNNGVTFELHDVLSRFASAKHQKYWNALVDEDIKNGVAYTNVGGYKVPTLSPTLNVLFIFVHLFYHMTASGVGLRQFCDLAVLLHVCHRNGDKEPMKYKDGLQIDASRLRTILEELGYFKAFKAIGAFLIEKLGLPAEEFPYELSAKDMKWVAVIDKNVQRRGNFGRANRSVKDNGLLHSLETGWMSIEQAWVFFRLAPTEVFGRFSKLFSWFFKRFTIRELKE